MCQIAVDQVAQLQRIEERASIALQAFASGEDSEYLVTSFLACLAGIYVECHDPDLPENEKIAAYGEVVEQAIEDRLLNVKVFFNSPLP